MELIFILIIYLFLTYLVGAFLSFTILTNFNLNTDDSIIAFFSVKYFFKVVFHIQFLILKSLNEFNLLGKILILFFITILSLGYSLFVFILLNLILLIKLCLSIFCFIFTKNHQWNFIKEMKEDYLNTEQVVFIEDFGLTLKTRREIEKYKKLQKNKKSGDVEL